MLDYWRRCLSVGSQWDAQCALPVSLEIVVAPVVGQRNDELEAGLGSLCNNDVQPLEGVLIIHPRVCLQVESLLHREPEDAHHIKILTLCRGTKN